MSRSRFTIIVLGGALLTSWLVSAAGTFLQDPAPVVVLPPAGPRDVEVLAATVREQADRLQTRLDLAPALGDVVRNPFAFAPRTRDVAPRSVPAPSGGPPPDAPLSLTPPAPVLRLVAIASDRGTRRAVLAVAGEITIVSVGDIVAGRYRVTAISSDVVELEDDRGGPMLRLGLD